MQVEASKQMKGKAEGAGAANSSRAAPQEADEIVN